MGEISDKCRSSSTYLKSLLSLQSFSFTSLVVCRHSTLSGNSWPAVVGHWWWGLRRQWAQWAAISSTGATINGVVHLGQASHVANILGLALCKTVLQYWPTGPLLVYSADTRQIVTVCCRPGRMNGIIAVAFSPFCGRRLSGTSLTRILGLWTPR